MDFIAIEPKGIDEVKSLVEKLPDRVADPVIEAVGNYLLNVYKTYPPYVHVKRAVAYPNARAISPHGVTIVGYFSWKQFKKVMALARDEKIPYKRTQAFRKAWVKVGKGREMIIANESPVAKYLMGPYTQSRMAVLGGWKDMETINRERKDEIMRKAQAALKKALKGEK